MTMIDFLAARIETFCQKKSHSMLALSKLSGVPYVTVRRIVQKEVGECGLETAVKILGSFCSGAEVLEFVKEYFGEVGVYLAQGRQSLAEPAPDLNRFLTDEKLWRALCLLDRERGATIDDLASQIGAAHVDRIIKEFDDNELLARKGEYLHLREKNFSHASPSATLDELAMFTRAFDTGKIGTCGHQLAAYVTEMSDEGAAKVQQIYREATSKLAVVIAEEKTKHNRTKQVFCGSISGLLGESK